MVENRDRWGTTTTTVRRFPWDITGSDNIDRRPTDVTCAVKNGVNQPADRISTPSPGFPVADGLWKICFRIDSRARVPAKQIERRNCRVERNGERNAREIWLRFLEFFVKCFFSFSFRIHSNEYGYGFDRVSSSRRWKLLTLDRSCEKCKTNKRRGNSILVT